MMVAISLVWLVGAIGMGLGAWLTHGDGTAWTFVLSMINIYWTALWIGMLMDSRHNHPCRRRSYGEIPSETSVSVEAFTVQDIE